MKIKTFIKYLKENIREDEFSHLNDDLTSNKKYEGRWEDDDDDDGYYDYDDDSTKDYDKIKSSNPKFNDYDDYDDYGDDDEEDHDIENLKYLLRQMFKNSGIRDISVTTVKNEDIVIEVYLSEKETLRNVIKVFEVANKLKRDILAQYDSEFEIWQMKNNKSVLSFGFTLDEGLEDDNMPF